MRRIHTLSIETEVHIAKIRWVKSDRALRVSLLQQEELIHGEGGHCGGASKVAVREEDLKW